MKWQGRTRRHLLWLRIVLLLGTPFLTACSNNPVSSDSPLVGRWEMVRYGSFDVDNRITFTFGADGRFLDARFQDRADGQRSYIFEANYEETETTIFFSPGTLAITLPDSSYTLDFPARQSFYVMQSPNEARFSQMIHGTLFPGLTPEDLGGEPLGDRAIICRRVVE